MNPRLILYVALILAVFDYIHRAEPQQQLPMVQADFPVCVPVHNGPIERPDRYGKPYRRRKDVA